LLCCTLGVDAPALAQSKIYNNEYYYFCFFIFCYCSDLVKALRFFSQPMTDVEGEATTPAPSNPSKPAALSSNVQVVGGRSFLCAYLSVIRPSLHQVCFLNTAAIIRVG
jgi:hypothetical protein